VQVTFIADGCGGHFGGRDAAYTAVSACADHLLKSSERKLIDVAKNCLEAAKKHIASVGTRYWGPNDFRCTLIVLLANKTEYALAHIGDGGADVRRDDGTWQRLITPQRDEHTGYLTGSLGPIPYGNYASMSIQRMQGDFLVAGSDGIYVDEIINLEEFWKWPRDAFNNAHVDLGTVLNTYIAECLQRFPNIFDDNVTALVLTTPKSSKSSSIIAKQSTTSQIYSAMSKYYRKMAE
jgi:serine/threonine protein phosphatase PrpC